MKNISIPAPKNRSFFFTGEVDTDIVSYATEQILTINERDEEIKQACQAHNMTYEPKPIKMFIDSPGGDIYTTLGLISVIKASQTPVHTIVTGAAMSAALLISVSGHRRFCYDNATYMYHQISSDVTGTLKEIEENTGEIQRLQKICESHIQAMTKITKDKAEKNFKTKTDWYFDAAEALKLKVVDEILG